MNLSRLLAAACSRLVVLVVAMGMFACARGAPMSAEARGDGGAPVDTEVMAYLSEARALHHQANVAEDSSDLPGAIRALDRLVHERQPHEGAHVPEVEEVLADTHARLAELRLRTKDMTGAETDVREGLEHAPDPTYFRGHLLEVSGIVEESRAADLRDAGRIEQAASVRARALELLGQAVAVQEQVVARSLGAADGGEAGAR